ncbi:MAG: 50S ribosomal protein L25/general stress protein Ctc [Holosporales bacterium]|jgi:large subunit ribosomal protein L25|nr:50S ribosomal protein L25/general stress protein Ctc [Holosporales bacterium]
MPSLVITKRNVFGRRAVKGLRYEGIVPGIIYGDNKEPVSVSVGEKELLAECYTSAFLGHIIEVEIDSKVEKFLPKKVLFNPVTNKPVHVDFLRVSKNSKVKVSIAIEFINEEKAPGLKKGGVMNVVVHKLECFCSPDSIPEKIFVDLSGKNIGDSFSLSDIKLPKGISPVNSERDSLIATLVGSRSQSEDEAQPEAAAATPEESSE